MMWTLHCTESIMIIIILITKPALWLDVSLLAWGSGAREGGLGNSSSGLCCCLLAGDRILRSELSKVRSKCSRELAALETLGELLAS